VPAWLDEETRRVEGARFSPEVGLFWAISPSLQRKVEAAPVPPK